jgi:hypothetical protein
LRCAAQLEIARIRAQAFGEDRQREGLVHSGGKMDDDLGKILHPII